MAARDRSRGKARRYAGRVLAGLLLLGLAYLAIGTWFAHRLMASVLTGTAFHGAQPAAVSDPRVIGYRGDPLQAFGLPFETLAVDTPGGPSPAWLIPAASDPPFAAIFVHGIGGHREDGYPFVEPLHAAGIPVLLITYRKDAGAPDADLHRFGLTEWQDLEAAARVMGARGHARLLIMGASMGGGIVGQYLARSALADRTVGVVLDAPALDFEAVVAHLMQQAGFPLARSFTPLAMRLFALTHGTDFAQARVLQGLADLPVPLFLSHGTADRLVPASLSHHLLAQRRGATVYVQSDGDHLQTRDRLPKVFARTLQDFAESLR